MRGLKLCIYKWWDLLINWVCICGYVWESGVLKRWVKDDIGILSYYVREDYLLKVGSKRSKFRVEGY